MWTAENWKDYEVLDTSNGEKLERWGKYLLVRPDPQVIWNTARTLPGWRKPNAHYHRSSKGGGEWEFFDLPEQWQIHYQLGGETGDRPLSPQKETRDRPLSPKKETGDRPLSPQKETRDRPLSPKKETEVRPLSPRTLTFNLKPFSFKHTGLFPEQAANWEWFYRKIREASQRRSGDQKQNGDGGRGAADRPIKVLNLFAYTGGATLAAAAAGAAVTHVDASKGMVTWARENARSSGLEEAPIRWIVDDCMKFVEREIRRGNHYDGIIMDPPSYGRGPKGEIWKIEDAIHPLVQACAKLLSEDPLFFLINSYTTGLAPSVLSYLLGVEVATLYKGSVTADEVGLPVSRTGLYLPCGASGRWEK